MNYNFDCSWPYVITEDNFNILNQSVTALKAMRMIFEDLTTKEVQEDFEEMIRDGVDFYRAVSKFVSLLNECEIVEEVKKGENNEKGN